MTIQYIKKAIKVTDSSSHFGKDSIEINIFNKANPHNIRRNGALVIIFDQKTYELVCAKSSDKNGDVFFRNIDIKNNLFFVISHDYKKEFNGVIADNIGGENVDD